MLLSIAELLWATCMERSSFMSASSLLISTMVLNRSVSIWAVGVWEMSLNRLKNLEKMLVCAWVMSALPLAMDTL